MSRHKRSHPRSRKFTATVGLFAVLAAAMSMTTWSAPASAAADKVFVCKYVGKPGVDERLQTGTNPISVSVSAIPGLPGVGKFFADGQDRSFVLAFDETPPGPEGDPEVGACPAPDGPDEIPVPTVPVSDPCGPNNAVYGAVPSGNYTVVRNSGGSITLNANDGFVFPGGQTSVTLPAPTDSGVACPVEDTNDGLCHATGSASHPYELIEDISSAGIFNGHYGEGRGDHQDGDDIIPPFTYQGQTYSQNWDAEGQAIYEADCVVEGEDPEFVVTVIPNQGSCEVRTPEARVTTNFASSIGYRLAGEDTEFVHSEVPAGTYVVTLPGVAKGDSVSYEIIVTPLDDSTEPIVKGPYTFSVPEKCGEEPPCVEFQDENPNADCYVEREPEELVESGTREGCRLGGVETTTAVFTTTYSFNEATQQWESSEAETSSITFTPYTAAELKERGCGKSLGISDTPQDPSGLTGAPATGLGGSDDPFSNGWLLLALAGLFGLGSLLLSGRKAGARS